ncbi:DUF2975 domain-containing protein [Brevundimonas bacteroides]|uniref:DUF2975 domain-containing protein n=1 Tax=Brevundimonas bacteroides TaxID=74311 RepID=UPI0004952D7C|nr:DUF2975 domain-containing protein [Brevundimonas bacteroides]
MQVPEAAAFRRLCAQYRWLAIFMVVSVGALLALMHIAFPLALWIRDGQVRDGAIGAAVFALPTVCYLYGVWAIGHGLGEVARGRLIQPALAGALHRVGLALGIGGLLSVFGVTNILRMIGQAQGGYLYFDVAGMTLGMIGGALFLLGRVVDHAGRLQAELDEMI